MNRLISIAPMMGCTDRHYRIFMRCITKQTLLYSEMITTGAVIHGNRSFQLGYSSLEHPLALQLGGSNPEELAKAARIAEDFGYDEINLNVGCPSSRVQSGRFGACLMKQPELVAECIAAMKRSVRIPITVKTRNGVDNLDSYDHLFKFVDRVSQAGCQTFIIHARKAWLKGLSPKENREVPPLDYDRVYQLKQDFPNLEILINGGIKTIDIISLHLKHVDGVMIGREAYANPCLFSEVDQRFFGIDKIKFDEKSIVLQYLSYVENEFSRGIRLRPLIRPLMGLFQGQPGARNWRRYLSEHGNDSRGGKVINEALAYVELL